MTLSGHIVGVALVLAVQVGSGPTQGGDSMSGLIVGQVVDADTGRPLAGALVAISGPPGPGAVPPPRILTGNDGRFVFRGLRRGTYNIIAHKAGFAQGAHGRTRPAGPSVPIGLADGERTGDAIIRLWKHASISGTIVDESGEHLIGVRVQAYRRAVISGRRRYVPSGAALSDDRGIYRIGGLIPGDYIVGAVSRQVAMPVSMAIAVTRGPGDIALAREAATQVVQVGGAGYVLGGGAATPPPPREGRLSIYPATFHPAAPAGDAATVVPLRAGEEHINADLQLAPVATVSVSGYVVGPDGAVTSTPLRLVAAQSVEIALDGESISTITDRSGNFTFPAVPSGHYTLRMVRGVPPPGQRVLPNVNTVVWTEVPVSVGIEHIENLLVEASPGLRIGGRIEFEGTGLTQQPDLQRIQIAVEPADVIASSGGGIVRVDGSGEFRSAPLPGGRYYVRVQNSPAGWMFKAATSDGRDLADIPLTLSADTLNVVVRFTDRWSGVRGSVQNRQGPDGAAAVIVFPTDTDTWASSGQSPRRVRMVRAGKSGEYSFNLPPGDYYVIAVPDAQTADWQDPAWMEAASRAAARVSIAEGERKTQDLRTRELR